MKMSFSMFLWVVWMFGWVGSFLVFVLPNYWSFVGLFVGVGGLWLCQYFGYNLVIELEDKKIKYDNHFVKNKIK